MTPTLTDEGKNQLIADKCPGRFKKDVFVNVWSYSHPKFGTTTCLHGSIIEDLNAMAVACATVEDQEELSIALCEVVNISIHERVGLAPEVVWSASRQRADAFAKVFGLW